MAKVIDTKAFADWAKAAFDVDFDNDPELQTALEKIGASNFTSIDQIRTLDLEAFLIVVGKLAGKPPTCDDVLSLSRRLLLRVGREYFQAASLLESIQQKRVIR